MIMLENWTDNLIQSDIVDFYYKNIKEWYTLKTDNKLLPFQNQETFYLLTEPTEIDYYE